MHGPVNLGLAEDALRSAEARKQAKRERAAAMDNIVTLLLERNAVKVLVEMAVPFLDTAPARSDTPLTPKQIARGLEELLNIERPGL